MKTLADRIRIMRLTEGRTPQQVGTLIGVGANYIEEIETGSITLSQIPEQTITALSELFNVDEQFLKTGNLAPIECEKLEHASRFTVTSQGQPQTINAPTFLRAGLEHMENRASQRDCEDGERSMAATVNSFNAMYGTHLTEQQGWMFMVFLKAARAKNGKFVKDDYEDGAAYFALAGEAASKEAA